MKQATDAVVKMALARGEESTEGAALRIVLRDLREHRAAGIEANKAMERMSELLSREGL